MRPRRGLLLRVVGRARIAVAGGRAGTLLLDEVAEMSLPAQTKLLRVLQEGTFETVGQSTPLRVDVRILSATRSICRTSPTS